MREEIINWIKQAEKDLSAARNSCNSGDYEWASFQANQSAEKALKSLYLKEKKEILPTHNLINLARKLDAPAKILDLLRDLNPDYILSRYPDAANSAPFETYTEKKAKEKINSAEEVLQWTKKQLER